MKPILLHVFVFGLTALLAAANPVENKPLKIARGKKYELRITGVPKVEMKMWNGQYRVDADGFLKLPLLGRVKIDDMTLDQAGAKIRGLLRDRMIYPQADIEIESPRMTPDKRNLQYPMANKTVEATAISRQNDSESCATQPHL